MYSGREQRIQQYVVGEHLVCTPYGKQGVKNEKIRSKMAEIKRFLRFFFMNFLLQSIKLYNTIKIQ